MGTGWGEGAVKKYDPEKELERAFNERQRARARRDELEAQAAELEAFLETLREAQRIDMSHERALKRRAKFRVVQ